MRTKLLGSLFLVVFLVIYGSAFAQTQKWAMAGVIFSGDGKPAARIQVSAVTAETSVIAGVTQTDANGRYRLDGLPAGRYYIAAGETNAPTYYPGATTQTGATVVALGASVGAINTLNVDFSLGLSGYKVRGQFRGIANLGSDNPSSRYTVRLTGPSIANQTQGMTLHAAISSDGSFEFPKVVPGLYTADIEPSFLGVNSRTIEVRSASISNVDFAIPRLVSIPGRIVVEDDGPIPQIGGMSAQGPTILLKLVLDAKPVETRYRLESNGGFVAQLPEGQYSILIGDGLPGIYQVTGFTYGNVDIRSKPAAILADDPKEMVLRLRIPTRPVAIRGRVTDAALVAARASGLSGDPSVALFGNNDIYPFRPRAAIRPDGSFEFLKIFPGNYSLEISNVTERVSITAAEKDIDGVVLVPRPPGSETQPKARISWRIVVDGGYPTPDFALTFTGPGTFQQRPANSAAEADGTYLSYAPAGEYRMRIDNIPESHRLKSMTSGSTDLLKESINLSRLGTAEILVSFEAVHSEEWLAIRGIVHGIENLPVPLVKPFLTIGGPSSLPLRIGASSIGPDGAFEFPKVLPGQYTMSLRAQDSDGSFPTLLTKSVTVSKESSPVIFEIPPIVVVHGRVVLDGNGPSPCLRLSIDESGRNFRLTCQPDGTFTTSLPAGEYKIQAWGFPAGYYRLKAFTYGDANLLQQRITIVPDAKTLVITLGVMEPAPWVKLSGRVVGNANQPITQYSKVYLWRQYEGQFEAPIKPDGTFEFSKILPGTYVVRTLPVGNYPSWTNPFFVTERGLSGVAVPVD